MKKTSSEITFPSPRFVWCNGNKEICWAKDREKNDTKGKYKSMPVSDVVRIVAGTDDGIDASSNEGGESVSKKKKHKKKRGSLFAESLDSSQLVNMMTIDAVFTIVSNKGDHHSLTLYLDPTASTSRVEGVVAKRRNEWVEIFRTYVDDANRSGPAGDDGGGNGGSVGESKAVVQ
jgi:hypothetical protein